MLSKVPDGWKEAKLGDCFDIKSSKRVLQKQWRNEGIPFYRGREITSLAEQGYVDNELFIERELYEEFASKHGVPKCGDILITAIGTIGNTFVVRESDRFYFKDASVLWLMRASDNLSALVNYWFQSELFFNQLDRGNGTTVDSLTINKLKSLSLALPPINEQHRIAEILSSVDESIQATQAVIEQAERVKCGLMEELLTGGLGSEAIERGEVPEGWVACSLGKIIILEYGKSLPEKRRIKGDYPVYGSAGIVGTHNDFLIESQSIVVGRKGTVGAVYKTSQPFFPIDTTYYVVARNEVNWDWLTALLEFLQLAKLNEATGVPGLNRGNAYKSKVSIPPINEQNRIAEILSSVDETIASHKANIEQQSLVKKGLMDDLLTGKVRTA